jgi:hypothetical protein
MTNNAGSLADEQLARLREALADCLKQAEDPSSNAYEGRCLWDKAAVFANWTACQNSLESVRDTASQALNDDSNEHIVQTFTHHRHRFASPQTVGEVGQLVERLRKPDFWSAHFHGGGRLSDDDDCAPFQAADTIASLTAERDAALARCEEMRGAAENEREECAKVADAYPKKNRFGPTTRAAVSAGIASTIRARAALGEGGDQTPPNPGTTLP